MNIGLYIEVLIKNKESKTIVTKTDCKYIGNDTGSYPRLHRIKMGSY